MSLMLIVLTAFLGIVSVASSWTEIRERTGFFHFNLLWTLAGAIGVFLALDLFLFFFLWELMLVPMYFLIAIWGHENRRYASLKFFLFTQGSGLLMLLAILALAFVHYRNSGVFSFNYFDLLGTVIAPSTALWIMLGFFIAFAVKLPAIPFHTWLPDAHTEAPTAGSIILAGVLLKTGAYGLLRFVVPLFPEAAQTFAPVAMTLGVAGVLYGALLAFAQNDLKRLVAYTSVSHMGFVLLGVFALNPWALNGAVMQMVAHGIGTGALFLIVGALQERMHTRDMQRMGGLWTTMPRMAALGLFFAIAALGLPGMGSFVGEFLVLLGAYRANAWLTAVATLGLIAAVVYALILVQKTFHGENTHTWRLRDSSRPWARWSLSASGLACIRNRCSTPRLRR
jgi:NADH-quinone oxidoreductase subunit M